MRLCILFAMYTSNPACCQNPAFQFSDDLVQRLCRLPLPQIPTVVPIPGDLLLLVKHLDTVSPVTAKHIRTWTKTQYWLKYKDLCSMVGLLKSQRKECSRIGGGKS